LYLQSRAYNQLEIIESIKKVCLRSFFIQM